MHYAAELIYMKLEKSPIFKGICLPSKIEDDKDVRSTYEFDTRLVKETMKDPDYYIFQNRFFLINDIIKKYEINKKEKLNLIDIGCAQGNYSLCFSKKWNIIGIDIRKHFLKYAKLKQKVSNELLIDFLLSDGHKLPFKDESFDIAFCTETIEHVCDASEFIKEIRRILHLKGILIITTPNGEEILVRKPDFGYISSLEKEKRNKILNSASTHIFLFREYELKILLESNGFKILESRFIESIMGFGTRFGTIWLPRILPFLPDNFFKSFDKLVCYSPFRKKITTSIFVFAEAIK